MKIYAIFEDNGQSYEDHYSGIMRDNFYLNRQDAEKALQSLQIKEFVAPTEKQWKESYIQKSYIQESYEEFVEDAQYWFNQDKYTYSLIEINVIE